MAAAARRLTDETDALRVCFDPNAPIQHVALTAERPLAWLDRAAEPAPEEAARAWTREQLTIPFDITRPSLFFWTLIRLAEDRFFLLVAISHLVVDGYWHVVRLDRLKEPGLLEPAVRER